MINIAELLKDARKGMTLYSLVHGEVEFAEVMDTDYVPIRVMKRGYGLRFDEWDFCDEFVIDYEWGSSSAMVKTISALKRRIPKWKLPVGTKVRATGRYIGDEWEFLVTK